jgi:hypothetical protein
MVSHHKYPIHQLLTVVSSFVPVETSLKGFMSFADRFPPGLLERYRDNYEALYGRPIGSVDPLLARIRLQRQNTVRGIFAEQARRHDSTTTEVTAHQTSVEVTPRQSWDNDTNRFIAHLSANHGNARRISPEPATHDEPLERPRALRCALYEPLGTDV